MSPRVHLLLLSLSILLLSTSAQDCFSNPSDPACSSYVYPDANSTSDLNNLCMMMDYMPGCTILNLCTSSHDHHGDQYCQSFSILADVCAYDMPGMGGCKSYTSLCSPTDSVIQQCTQNPPIPGLPTTTEANEAVKSMCNQHYMVGCEKCVDNGGMFMDCDILTVYSQLCLSMPGMGECAQWNEMCTEGIPAWGELCPSDDPVYQQPPAMKMYFHTGILDYVLFESWVPRTDGAYAGAVIGVMLFAFLFEALQTLRSYMEFKWRLVLTPPKDDASEAKPLINDNSLTQLWGRVPFNFGIEVQRAALHTVEVASGYLLMLIAMTFNVGLFLALLAGFFLGKFAFGRFRILTTESPSSCCS